MMKKRNEDETAETVLDSSLRLQACVICTSVIIANKLNTFILQERIREGASLVRVNTLQYHHSLQQWELAQSSTVDVRAIDGTSCSGSCDVQPDRAWLFHVSGDRQSELAWTYVGVLEVVQVRVAERLHQEAHSFASWAAIRARSTDSLVRAKVSKVFYPTNLPDVDRGAWLESDRIEHVCHLRCCGIGGLLRCNPFEDCEFELPGSRVRIRRGLELLLRWEQKLERTCLASKSRRYIKRKQT